MKTKLICLILFILFTNSNIFSQEKVLQKPQLIKTEPYKYNKELVEKIKPLRENGNTNQVKLEMEKLFDFYKEQNVSNIRVFHSDDIKSPTNSDWSDSDLPVLNSSQYEAYPTIESIDDVYNSSSEILVAAEKYSGPGQPDLITIAKSEDNRHSFSSTVLNIDEVNGLSMPKMKQIVEQPQILIDEEFTDWNEVPTFVEDTDDDYGNGVDFKKLWVTNDENYLFVRIDYFDEFIFQEDTSSFLLINTDNNTSTGSPEYNFGAEIKYNFGQKSGQIFQNNTWNPIGQNDLKYVSAPTVSSSSFEICINLNNDINSLSVFPTDNIKIKVVNYLENLDVIPNNNNSLSYTIQRNNGYSYAEYSIAKENQTAIRLLSYNVVYDQIFKETTKPVYQRILNAISPDIIVFEEIYNHTSEETAQQVEEYLPSGTGQTWYHSKIQPVNDNQYSKTDLVVVSRYPILSSYKIKGLKNESVGYERSNAAFILDLPKTNTNLLLIAAHLPCCQSNNAREIELQEIMAFIRDAKTEGGNIDIPKNTPIIIAGDMNLVGYSNQVDIFLNGDLIDNATYGDDFLPDWDNTPFADVKPTTTNFPGIFTWYEEKSSYSPGRLDYIVYSDYTLNVANSFSLFTKSLGDAELNGYGLQSNDTYVASDHLPVVVDFTFTDIVGVEKINQELPKQHKLNQNYPNPFNPSTTIEYSIPAVASSVSQRISLSKTTLKVYDTLGKEIDTLVNEQQSAGNYRVTFDAASLPSGIYFYRLVSGSFSETKKLTLMK